MKKIKELRQESDLEQKDLAKILNIGKGSISNWEVGRTEPSIEYLIKMANYFNVSVDYILDRENENTGLIEITNDLTDKESKLLGNFRKMSEAQQNITLRYSEIVLNETQKDKKQNA